ncbi:MAG: hypothetical protein NTW54_08055, partial [Bacteroidetes bacterium]|nr:hypothetical protein [Bacteroidota bacterium]
VMGYCYEAHSELIKPYLEPLLKNLVKPGLHDAVKRNTLKVLQSISVPDKLLGSLVDLCFGFLYSAGEAIAVKSLSINILVKTCAQYPALQIELGPILNLLLDHDSPAIQYTSKHGLAVLKKTKK